MLMRRMAVIAMLILAGFVILSIGVWALTFNVSSSEVPASSVHWWLARLPVLIGVLLIVAGFLVLGRTRVARLPDEIDYEDPTG